MSGVSRVPFGNTQGKDGQNCQTEGRPALRVTRINGQRISFRDLARFAWPEKTEANLAFYLQVDPRTARRWLADDGKNEPPAEAMVIIMREIMIQYGKRN